MSKRNNITGIAYSQRGRYINAASILGADATARIPAIGSVKQFLVAVTAWSPTGDTFGRTQVEVISMPSVTTEANASLHNIPSEKGAQNNPVDILEGYPTGTPSYPSGTVLRIKAIANSNGKFVGWADGVAAATRTVTVTANAHYVARFISAVQIQNLRLYCLNSRGRIQGSGLTEETANNAGVLTRVYTANVNNGDSISFKAVPKEGYHFVRWNVRTGQEIMSGVNLSSPSITLRMNHSASLEALFEVDQQDPNDNPGSGNGGNGGQDEPPYGGQDEPPYGGDQTGDDPGAYITGGGQSDIPTVIAHGGTDHSYDIIEKAKPFVKKWWWAILIVGYIIYKERKGGLK